MSNPNPANPVTQGAQPPAVTGEQGNIAETRRPGYTSDTKISTMDDLKNEAPKVYKSMLKGIAQNIIKQMREHQERLKKAMRKGQQG